MSKRKGRPENLYPRSSDEARENGRLGGIASGAARREKKMLIALLETKLAKRLPDGRTVAQGVVDAWITLAMSGDMTAIKELRDSVEGKPLQQVKVDADVNMSISSVLQAARARCRKGGADDLQNQSE